MLEIISGILIGIDLVQFVLKDNYSVFITFGILLLANLYFFLAFYDTGSNNKIQKFIYKLGYWSLSIMLMGLLFKMQNWPMSDSYMKIGLSGVILSFLYFFNEKFIKKDKLSLDKRLLTRLIAFGLIAICFIIVEKIG